MKMTLKSILAGFVACSLLLSSFTCVFAEEPLQENNVTAQQTQEDVDSTAVLPDQQESEKELDSQPENESENKKEPEKLEDEDSLTKDDTKDSEHPAENEIAEIAMPVAEPAAGTYDESQTVSLSCKTEGTSIYYTTDGSEPTENSHLYKEPILIESSKTIKAKAFLKDLPASDTLEAQYVINLQMDTKELQSSEANPPKLTGVSVFKETVTDGGTVTVRATASAFGKNNHIKYIKLIFANTEDDSYQTFFKQIENNNGKFEAEFSISPYDLSGVYQLQFVEVADVNTEQQYCIPNIDPDNLEPYIDYLDDDCKDLDYDISFTVNNSKVDTTPPEVKEISFVTPKVTVPGKVKVSARITDDESGVDSTDAISVTVWNQEKHKEFDIELTQVAGSKNDGIYEGTSDALPTYTSSGTYFIAYIKVIDNLGNEQVYRHPEYFNWYNNNLPIKSCKIINNQSDDKAPTISSASVDKTDINVTNEDANININLNIKEAQSGLNYATLDIHRIGDYDRVNNKSCYKYFSNKHIDRDGMYTFSFQFNKYDAPGTYEIEGISLSDNNNNSVTYSDSNSDSNYLPLPNNITFKVKNDSYHEPEHPDCVQSDREYNFDGDKNPDILNNGSVSWHVPGTSDSNKIGNLNIINAYPDSEIYIPLGICMKSMIEVAENRYVKLNDLKIKTYKQDTDPFELIIEENSNKELIKEIYYIEEKKLANYTRTCYLKFRLNNTFETKAKTTTGKITFRALKDCEDPGAPEDPEGFCYPYSNYLKGDSFEINYSITVNNTLIHNGDKVELGDRICMQPTANEKNTLIWGCNRAALEFQATSNPEKFNATLTTRPSLEVYRKYSKPNDEFWFFSFSGSPRFPSTSTATLTLGIPWNDDESHPSISEVYIYEVNRDNTLTDVTKQFTYSKDGLIEGWSASTISLDRYMISGRDLLNKPSSGGDHSSGGHSGGGHSGGGGGGGRSGGGGGGGGGKGGGGGSGASANLIKAATVSKSATASVQTAINSAIKTKVKAATANIPITAGNEISPATVRSVVRAVNAASYKKGIAVTPQVTLSKMSAGKLVSKIAFNPKLFTSKTNIKLGVALDDKASRAALSKQYKNKMQMLKFTQKGTFGMPVTVTAKMNLTGMNTKTLQFFTYDRVKKTLMQIVAPNYSIDQQGYLHFTTNMGETVVITDSALLKK